MYMEWLASSMSKRVEDVSDLCCCNSEVAKLHSMSLEIFTKLEMSLPSECHLMLHELENLCNLNTGLIIELSYKIGLEDGAKLNDFVNK